MTIDQYMKLPWKTVVQQDFCDGQVCFIASNPELGSCLGQGDTPGEALADLEAARRDLLEVILSEGDPIPEPAEWQAMQAQASPTMTTKVSVERPAPIPEQLPSLTCAIPA